jgi:serine/threonine protein kinase
MIQKISEGTYGYIFCDKNHVYKISKSKEWDCSMIRETYLLSFLKSSEYVVDFYGSIPPAVAERQFHFLIKEKLVETVQGIILEKMDCNLKEFCAYLYTSFQKSPEILAKYFKKIFEKCLLALYDLQKYYILHNDLKLINILISYKNFHNDEFQLKLCDFGLGIQTSSFGMDEQLCLGTCKYSAPEMKHKSVTKFYKKKPCHPQSLAMDIYSIGVILVHVMCILTNKKQIEKVTAETFLKLLCQNEKGHYFYHYLGYEFLDHRGIDIIMSLLQENPENRENPRNCLKLDFFNNRIHRFKFVENMKVMLKNYTYDFDKDLYIRFEQKMKEWNFESLPFEIFINVYHCMIQIKYHYSAIKKNSRSKSKSKSYNSAEESSKDSSSSVSSSNSSACGSEFPTKQSCTNGLEKTNKKEKRNCLSFLDMFKLAIGWVLSIYHHKESQRYRKMISNSSEKQKFKKFEYKHRVILEQIKIIPFMSMFKSCEIKNEIHRQKIFNYIFS